MSTRQTLEEKLGTDDAQKLIDEINDGIANKKGAALKTHIDKKLSDFGITDPAISETIARQVKPL